MFTPLCNRLPLSGGGLECPGGSHPDGAGDHQLLSLSRPPPQPEPRLHSTLPEGALCTLPHPPDIPRYHTEH